MARRKISKPEAESLAELAGSDSDSLPELTAQQARFVEGLLAGKSASDAYRAAYDCSNMGQHTIWTAASKLKCSNAVTMWLSAGRKAYLGTATVTIDGHVRELERLKELALEAGNHGAAIQAEQLRGKASGLYIDRFENVTQPDPIRALQSLAKADSALGDLLRARYGQLIEGTAIEVKALPQAGDDH
jgi:hypothetical protein